MIMNAVLSRMALALVAGSVLGGCASTAYNVAPLPPPTYQVLGKATGKTCGSLGVLGTAYYFIPIGLNSRVEGAYQEALKSVPGATSLINVEMKEDWFLVAYRYSSLCHDFRRCHQGGRVNEDP